MRALLLTTVLLLAPVALDAQGRGGPAAPFDFTQGVPSGSRGAPPPTGRAGAPVDLTGYWVSLVTDDWRYRMLTPPKGNIDYLPITAEGRKIADAWDPAKDEAAGEQCKAYGAVGVMRMPGRLRVTWESDNVLKMETDAGTQTRRFFFADAPAAAAPAWQGTSTARWNRPFTRSAEGLPPQGELRVATTRMRPGYIRRNGIPYSANAALTEYFVRLVDDDSQEYLAVTQVLEDAQYLAQPIVRTMLFKKQADGSGWNPTPCSAQ
jgi:hypothetical protein